MYPDHPNDIQPNGAGGGGGLGQTEYKTVVPAQPFTHTAVYSGPHSRVNPIRFIAAFIAVLGLIGAGGYGVWYMVTTDNAKKAANQARLANESSKKAAETSVSLAQPAGFTKQVRVELTSKPNEWLAVTGADFTTGIGNPATSELLSYAVIEQPVAQKCSTDQECSTAYIDQYQQGFSKKPGIQNIKKTATDTVVIAASETKKLDVVRTTYTYLENAVPKTQSLFVRMAQDRGVAAVYSRDMRATDSTNDIVSRLTIKGAV